MLQTKDKWFLKQLQPKSQNQQFHTPAANSLLLQKWTWHITTHFVVEGHICPLKRGLLIKVEITSVTCF